MAEMERAGGMRYGARLFELRHDNQLCIEVHRIKAGAYEYRMPGGDNRMTDIIKGYKAFHTSDDGGLQCRDMTYEVGKSYVLDGKPELCWRGYHFCRRLVDCYDWYKSGSRICEVEASGVVIDGRDGKSVTDHIHIVRELDRHEVLDLANVGKGCTGIRNSGDRNSGDDNSGDGNSGYWNSGDRNSGNLNSGYGNSGCSNSGNWNSGDWNSGNWNSGDWNSGDWNKTNFSAGVLCTQAPECLIFDKPSGMTLREWRDSEAANLMDEIDVDSDRWICADDMTDEEKAAHPDFATTDGYLQRGTGKPDFAGWWAKLNDNKRSVILAIPNFDAKKWKLITGIEVA
jgi:hypothetical protein